MRVGRSRTFIHFQSLHPAVKGHAGLGRGTWLRPCGRVAAGELGAARPTPRLPPYQPLLTPGDKLCCSLAL